MAVVDGDSTVEQIKAEFPYLTPAELSSLPHVIALLDKLANAFAAGSESVVLGAGTAVIGKLVASTPFRDTVVARTDQTMKASAGVITMLRLRNVDAAAVYFHLFDAANTTGTPTLSFHIPASGYLDLDNLRLNFATAIHYSCSTAIDNTGDPTTGCELNASYE